LYLLLRNMNETFRLFYSFEQNMSQKRVKNQQNESVRKKTKSELEMNMNEVNLQ